MFVVGNLKTISEVSFSTLQPFAQLEDLLQLNNLGQQTSASKILIFLEIQPVLGLHKSPKLIVNVIGKGERGVALWTTENGIVRNSNPTYKADLRTIIWPGESPSIPKGWVLPTNGMKSLRIGVPVKEGFSEFVKEYISFETSDGKPDGNYNDLIYQVYLQKYDAVVGDTTTVANRSLYVDFTLPYTESGVSMIVRIIDKRSKNAWVFLKPLTWDLWVTSACFFVFIGFVIWVLEHQDRVVSNLAQFMPTITDINELIKNGERMGYQKGSFVHEFLKWMKFDETKLVIYESPEELDELFSNRSSDGGIAAAFEEIPYMKLFLAKYCSKYTAVQPTYKFGFGFVFPKRSPLIPDVSMQVLNVTEGAKMVQFEKAWFGQTPSCPELTSSVSSNSIGLNSFWGLFLTVGVASSIALIICITTFLYENRDTLVHLDPQLQYGEKLKPWQHALITKTSARILSGKVKWYIEVASMVWMQLQPRQLATNCPPSPSSLSIQTESNFAFFRDQETPSSEYGDPFSPNRQTSPQ
ncbi:Glutamate receptor 2.7 [Vitis vinifera]|uniref:Glutamate receptor 2.7 n=1 Tax=Vitis vinifera TaxID=29760 RepID=A0A438D9G4_VITVI|nr:Glutamate receptor 2.7 [Vitis vinifera]